VGVVNLAKWLILDAKRFGLGFVAHNVHRVLGTELASIPLRGIGSVWVRPMNSDVDTIRQVFGGRDYALDSPAAVGERVRRRYEEILADDRRPIIVDAGANIGAASLWFKHEFPESAIVAVEPDPSNAAILRRNFGNDPHGKVLEAAIGDELGFVTLAAGNPEGEGWAMQTERADDGVPVVTIHDAFAAAGDGVPFIVKIDIEGFERDLFRSNTTWLADTYVVFIEPHDWMMPGQHTSQNFQKAMAEHPFELFLKGENLVYVRG
jgi:FkbM family methyltransferase